MFECLKFIFGLVADFLAMLFTIDIGPMSLGMFACIIFLFLPMVLFVVNILIKNTRGDKDL